MGKQHDIPVVLALMCLNNICHTFLASALATGPFWAPWAPKGPPDQLLFEGRRESSTAVGQTGVKHCPWNLGQKRPSDGTSRWLAGLINECTSWFHDIHRASHGKKNHHAIEFGKPSINGSSIPWLCWS